MTVIAWDGKTLAADKRTSFGGLHATTTKLHKLGDAIAGGCGNSGQLREVLQWIGNGADVKEAPPALRDTKEGPTIMVILPGGRIQLFDSAPVPIIVENRFWAVGCGRDFAMAAMYLGRSAREAVEIASALDSGCGNGVDTLELA